MMYVTLLAVVNLAAGLILAEAVAADGLPEAVSDEAQAILDEGIERLRAHGIQARSRPAFGDPGSGAGDTARGLRDGRGADRRS